MFLSDLIWMLLTQFDTNMNFNGGVQGSSCWSAGWHHPDPGVASGHQQGVKRLRWLLVCLGFYTTELGSPYTEVRVLSQRLVSSHLRSWHACRIGAMCSCSCNASPDNEAQPNYTCNHWHVFRFPVGSGAIQSIIKSVTSQFSTQSHLEQVRF